MNYSDKIVVINGKEVLTSQAVWEQMLALSRQVDRARMQARIAMAVAVLSLGSAIALSALL